jgi:hypothetical protein
MAYYPNNPNGQTTMANSSPVVIASDQSTLSVRLAYDTSISWKQFNATTTQTGTTIWTPVTGGRISISYLAISTYGTTAARVILWFGASADTTYTAGTDQLVFAGSFAPTTTSKPGAIIQPSIPIISLSADHRLKITTDAGISIDVTAYGYDFGGTP